MNKRHCVQIPNSLWEKLCDDAAKQMKKRRKSVTPSKRIMEILENYLKEQNKK